MAGYGQEVATVQLRPIRADDLAALGVRPQDDDPFGFFGRNYSAASGRVTGVAS